MLFMPLSSLAVTLYLAYGMLIGTAPVNAQGSLEVSFEVTNFGQFGCFQVSSDDKVLLDTTIDPGGSAIRIPDAKGRFRVLFARKLGPNNCKGAHETQFFQAVPNNLNYKCDTTQPTLCTTK